MTQHQEKQLEVIDQIEHAVQSNTTSFTTVSPVNDFRNDKRICLTSAHLPKKYLTENIYKKIINPLKTVEPDIFYYPEESLHMTIKNIRVINDPPHFTNEDITKAENLFSEIIPQHKKFAVYLYRLLLFPNNLALMGTTDPELDSIISDLNTGLETIHLADDKIYSNSKYFFCNMTLARFSKTSEQFKQTVNYISNSLVFEPYTIDSVTLLTGNAVFSNRTIINSWKLQ